ncbi:DUF4168 domain-containing protein [Sphingomonas koreensis]|nr:DUF4168 domain-containing protein [Sphingomonas koreensis]
MNTVRTAAAMIAACTLGTTAALAQTATPAPAPTTAAPTATAPAASYTDADVNQFATAVIAVQKVQQDSTVAATDKQTKMAAAVQASGLSPAKFNAMAQATQSDPALQQRVQTAATAQISADPASAPAPTTPAPASPAPTGQ